jgi:hypothetical protein
MSKDEQGDGIPHDRTASLWEPENAQNTFWPSRINVPKLARKISTEAPVLSLSAWAGYRT